jgi:hypothetical protein
MQGRGRRQLSPFHKAGTFPFPPYEAVAARATLASVTYDDPNGSWESWEPGASWGGLANGSNGGRSVASRADESHTAPPKSDPALRWDDDDDTNLRHPKPLPRTLITMSELDWEDSEECATELWRHPQRPRVGAGREAPQQRPPGRQPDPRRAPQAHEAPRPRAHTGIRPTGAQPQRTAAPGSLLPPRTAEPTARMRNGVMPARAPQRLPAAPPPRAAIEPAPQAPRERTITQPGAAPQPSADARAMASLPLDPRASATLPLNVRSGPPLQLPASATRSLLQTQVSGFATAPQRSELPPPPPPAARSVPPAMPALPEALAHAPHAPHAPIESLRDKLGAAQRLQPPPRQQSSAHIPTIIGTPAEGAVPGLGRAAASEQSQVLEQLQEQLLEAMARARVQEARAAEAEKSVEQVEEQLESIVRNQLAETDQLRDQLRLTSDQLRVTEVRAVEAERRSLVAERPHNLLHLAEAELTPRPSKQGRANLILSGLLASSLSFGGAAYFMFYAPLQKQVTVLEQQRTQEAAAHENALTSLKAQSAAERQGLETQNSELRAQLDAARAEALAMNADDGKRGRSRRASLDPDAAEDTPAGTRSARAIERRMKRSRASSSEARAGGDDSLDGL